MRTRLVLLTALLAVIGLSATSWPGGVTTVEAAIDPTGDWNFTISGGGSIETCSGQIVLSGDRLTIVVPCRVGTHRGDFAKEDGTFDVRLGQLRFTHLFLDFPAGLLYRLAGTLGDPQAFDSHSFRQFSRQEYPGAQNILLDQVRIF